MQLAPIAPTASVHVATVARPQRATVVVPAAPVAAPRTPSGPAADAVRGAAATTPGTTPGEFGPIVDFPGIEAGDQFDIVSGSKAGPIGVRGDATIDLFDNDHATFRVAAGRFGFHVNVVVNVERVDATTVRITSTGTGIPDQSALGTIIESRTNFAEFERTDGDHDHTVISRDANGVITLDAVVPTVGNAHLVLEPRSADLVAAR